MFKTDFIDALASNSGMSKTDSRKMLDAFITTTLTTLQKGEKISLKGFGTFEVNNRQAREGRNPSTGENMHIAERKAIKFKAGKELVKNVNSK